MKTGRLFVRALTDPETAADLVHQVARDVSEATCTVSDVARAVSAGVPIPQALLDATVSLSSMVLADASPREPEPTLPVHQIPE